MHGRIRNHAIAFTALFLGLTGVAQGANTIGSADIINGEVKSVDIGNGEVHTADIGTGEVKTADIGDAEVTARDIGSGQVTAGELAAASVLASKLAANSVTGAKVADNTLTGADIDESTLTGLPAADAWNLTGNAGTTAGDFLGTTDSQPFEIRVDNARGLRIEPASDGTNASPNVIGGSADNSVAAGVYAGTIGGGGRGVPADPATANRVTDHQGVVGGGANNQAGDNAGGPGDAVGATVGGGVSNNATSVDATVAGGFLNSATAAAATVGGGQANQAPGNWSTVPGGTGNIAAGDFSFAAGTGAQASHEGALVLSDSNFFLFPSTAEDQFSVRATGGTRLVSGIDGSGNPVSGVELQPGTAALGALVNGQPLDLRVNNARGLRIDPASDGTNVSPNVIGGIADNAVTPGVYAATIAGGGRSAPGAPGTANRVTDNFGSIGGGANNQAGDGAGAVDDQQFATIGGGQSNFATGVRSTIGGGFVNAASAINSTVAGGLQNTASGIQSSTVGGGAANTASGQFAVIGGGSNNTASGTDATVPGGSQNVAGNDYSLAAGRRANAAHSGSFVWADTTNSDFFSSATNTFNVRATGGTRIVSGVDGSLAPNAGVTLAPGSGSWASLSDRHAKRAIKRVSPNSVLRKLASVPVSTWSYRAQDRSIRHIGPMAQDFYRAFGVGESRRRIDSVDADGVALVAIKGLSRKLRVEHARRVAQQRRLDRLEARIAKLETGGGKR